MRLLGGQKQILHRLIGIEPGLYAFLHEGSNDHSHVAFTILEAPGRSSMARIHPINTQRHGLLHERQFAIVNALEATELLGITLGDLAQRESTVAIRVVKLGGKTQDQQIQTPISRPNPMPRRYTSRLIEVDPGVHLIKFAAAERSSETILAFSCLEKDMTLIVAEEEADAEKMSTPQVAVIDAPNGGSVLLTMTSAGYDRIDFAGLSIRPLERILARLTRSKASNSTLQNAPATNATFSSLSSLRLLWMNRPLGLDLAVSIREAGRTEYSDGLMSGSWIEAAAGNKIEAIKISLLGVGRERWSIAGTATFNDGSTVDIYGANVKVEAPDVYPSVLNINLIDPNGTFYPLIIEYKFHF